MQIEINYTASYFEIHALVKNGPYRWFLEEMVSVVATAFSEIFSSISKLNVISNFGFSSMHFNNFAFLLNNARDLYFYYV